MNALIKLGIRENEVRVLLPMYIPVEHREAFKFTFGVEIECIMNHGLFRDRASYNGVSYRFEGYNHNDCRDHFKFVTDGSLTRTYGRNGDPIECVSPVLDGDKNGFDKLKACCESLNEAEAYVNKSTGLHVHIGASALTGEQYVNVFKNYQKLERVIDSFMAPSRKNNTYSRTIRVYDFENCETQADILSVLQSNRYHKVNPCSYTRHHTIEFRQHQGTTNFEKIKNWVNFCAKLVAYSMNHVITEEVTSIDAIPFLTAREKAFFNRRKAAFETGTDREVA